MAWPKQTEDVIPAKERIEEAFWRLLAVNDYDKISVRMLAAEARVNHNTIYYYYANIDEIAKSAFAKILIRDLSPFLSVNFREKEAADAFTVPSDILLRFGKIRLFASANSHYLQKLLKTGLIEAWLSSVGGRLEYLPFSDQLKLDFIFSGIVAILGKNDAEISGEDWRKLFQSELAQALLQEMRTITG